MAGPACASWGGGGGEVPAGHRPGKRGENKVRGLPRAVEIASQGLGAETAPAEGRRGGCRSHWGFWTGGLPAHLPRGHDSFSLSSGPVLSTSAPPTLIPAHCLPGTIWSASPWFPGFCSSSAQNPLELLPHLGGSEVPTVPKALPFSLPTTPPILLTPSLLPHGLLAAP